MRTLLPLLFALLVAGPAYAQRPYSSLTADPQPEPEIDPDAPKFVEHARDGSLTTYYLTLTPKSPEPPVLQYRLLPTWGEMVEGNAANFYHRAFQLVRQQIDKMDDQPEFWRKVMSWREMPLSELPVEEMERELVAFASALEEARLGALRKQCDWGLPLRERPRDIFMIRMDEIHDSNSLNYILTVRVRLRLAQNRFDEAIKDLQTGTALARHVGQEGLLVSPMTGCARSEALNIQLLTALALDDAPNLYWSISNLPQPLIDPRNGVAIEREAPFLMFPELRAARTENRDEAYWDEKLMETLERLEAIFAGFPDEPKSTVAEQEAAARLADAVSHIPAARKALVEKMGYAANEVKEMPGSRVLLLYSGHAFEKTQAEQFLAFDLSYREAKTRIADLQRDPADGINLMTLLPSPSTRSIRAIFSKNERTFALLRTVEALRDFVATHDRVPESLEEVTNLPIPINPLTGQPFGYRVEDADARKVVLETGGEDYQAPTRLKITFRATP